MRIEIAIVLALGCLIAVQAVPARDSNLKRRKLELRAELENLLNGLNERSEGSSSDDSGSGSYESGSSESDSGSYESGSDDSDSGSYESGSDDSDSGSYESGSDDSGNYGSDSSSGEEGNGQQGFREIIVEKLDVVIGRLNENGVKLNILLQIISDMNEEGEEGEEGEEEEGENDEEGEEDEEGENDGEGQQRKRSMGSNKEIRSLEKDLLMKLARDLHRK